MKKPNFKATFTLLFVLLSIIIVTINYSFNKDIALSPPPPSSQLMFEQTPPYPIRFWVQKMTTPTPNGQNMIFRVSYESDFVLPPTINTYNNGNVAYTLRDDGVYPDNVAGDKIYSTLKKENIAEMLADIATKENLLLIQETAYDFIGHVGELKQFTAPLKFDLVSFLANQEVQLNKLLIDPADCSAQIKSQNSLFITDLSVVEDPFRTYNVFTGTGSPTGVWTFGTLMKNIENGTHPDGIRGFLKDWVKNWVVNQTVNGQLVESRDFVIETLIDPWLAKANNTGLGSVNITNWEAVWDATPPNALKNNAPFKLTAIVNRIDVRGNLAYNPVVTNAGETRFIYTLVNPITGEIPIHPDQTISKQANGVGFVDWRGLNVIFEYGNVQTSSCALQQLAQQWLDLSAFSFGFSYRGLLQSITDLVTTANSKPTKPNGSAINRIRTNERLFPDFVDPDSHVIWEKSDWEFRQFEVDAVTHKLKLVPLTNNPPVTANAAFNIEEDYSSMSVPISNQALLDWIYAGHKNQVKNGNFNLPTNLLAVSGLVRREESQYFDFNTACWLTKSPSYNESNPSEEAKKIRQQLSLNTCVGCHAGETKTRFTHINPVKYGELTRYWTSTPSGASNITQDEAFYPNGGSDPLRLGGHNSGTTDPSDEFNFDIFKEIKNQDFFQAVSPFLIGRRLTSYTSSTGFPNNWDDDNISDANDNNMLGYFYVNDPSNSSSNSIFPYLHDRNWGYNDLLRRKNDLCLFINSGCPIFPSSLQLMTQLSKIPLPLGGH